MDGFVPSRPTVPTRIHRFSRRDGVASVRLTRVSGFLERWPTAARIVSATVLVLVAACSSSAPKADRATTASPTTTATTSSARQLHDGRADDDHHDHRRAAVATKPLAAQAAAYLYAFPFDGRTRDYRLHVPPAAAGGKPLPLVLNLHGATQNALLQEAQSGMDASSDRDGYLVAYPDGTRIATKLTPDPVAKDAQYGFDAGACCGLPSTDHLDDVGFLLQVIADVARHTPVDLRRVYVTGMSNGGMMAYAMAAQAPQAIAAIASVSGQVELPAIHPARPVPTLEFHSVDDPIAKWVGVPNANPKLRYSVMDGIDQWVKADGCNPTPHDGEPIVGGGSSAGLSAVLVTYTGCRGRHRGRALAAHRFGPRVARRPVQHRAAQELDPRRRRPRHLDHRRQRGDVVLLPALRSSRAPPDQAQPPTRFFVHQVSWSDISRTKNEGDRTLRASEVVEQRPTLHEKCGGWSARPWAHGCGTDAADCPGPRGAWRPEVDHGRCEAKGPCVPACPYDVLAIEPIRAEDWDALGLLGKVKSRGPWPQARPTRSTPTRRRGCGLCIAACPEHAINSGEPRSVATPLRRIGRNDQMGRDCILVRGRGTSPHYAAATGGPWRGATGETNVVSVRSKVGAFEPRRARASP